MDPLDYLRIIRRRWLVVLAAGLVSLVAAVVTLAPQPASTGTGSAPGSATGYKATTTLLQRSTDGTSVPLGTLPVLVSSGAVPRAAARALGYDGDPNELAQGVNALPDETTHTLAISVTDPDAVRAAAVADAFGDALVQVLRKRSQGDIDSQVKLLEDVVVDYQDRRDSIDGTDEVAVAKRARLETAISAFQNRITSLQVSSATAGFDLSVLQPATAVPVAAKGGPATAVTAPNRWTRFALLVLFGLGLGAALTLGIERFDTRLRGRTATETALRLPVVASVPALSHRRRGRREVASAVDPLSGIAESYRSLRSAVQQLPSRPVMRLGPLPGLPATAEDNHRSPVRNPRVLLFVSGSAGEGKTTSIANLAFAFAEAGRRVIVLDCDFRHPEMHAYLGVPASRGLSDLLAADRQVSLASVLQPTEIAGVQLAQAGGSVEHPGALMGLVAPFVAEAAELADMVLIDAPPALVASDAVDLMPTVESAVVVVREGRTGRGEAERLATLLSQVRVPCLGVVQIAARDAGAAYFRTESSKRRAARRAQPRDPSASQAESGRLIWGDD